MARVIGKLTMTPSLGRLDWPMTPDRQDRLESGLSRRSKKRMALFGEGEGEGEGEGRGEVQGLKEVMGTVRRSCGVGAGVLSTC